ncbi:ABC transporter permease [Lysinibacillus sp. MHQ-1]|nr:ABC transporter permease [Lysinibacillus sp. MHQ-1]
MLTLVTLFTVITAASIVSSEFSTGTIKMLLTRPMSRAKVLTSKLLTTFLFGLFFSCCKCSCECNCRFSIIWCRLRCGIRDCQWSGG